MSGPLVLNRGDRVGGVRKKAVEEKRGRMLKKGAKGDDGQGTAGKQLCKSRPRQGLKLILSKG